ncbi:MAG: helix-turn-helix transcriptional regulator [Sphaerochaetaceae bacterium]|nr:helix-turn-helix transcriptional regulator [Sphaerochaetaceae bacterium]
MLKESATQETDSGKFLYIHTITEDIYRVMKEKGVTKADLARTMNTSPANITQILNGTRNFTIGKLVDIAQALNSTLTVKVS